MVAVLLCLACLLFSSCEYDLENAFYRADDTDARTRVCYTLSDSETPHPSSELYTIAVFSDIHFGGKGSTRHEQDFLNWLEKSKEEGKCPEFCFLSLNIICSGSGESRSAPPPAVHWSPRSAQSPPV